MTQLDELVANALDGVDTDLEMATFGVNGPKAITRQITAYLEQHLAPCHEGLFYRRGTGIVIGLQLVDGRRVVLKVHRPWAGLDLARLQTIQRIMVDVAERGLPVPVPLVAPSASGGALFSVESYLEGVSGDGHRPEVRRAIANLLHRLIDVSSAHRSDAHVARAVLFDPTLVDLWPEPHDLRFDFGQSDPESAEIDEIARRAKSALREIDAPLVVGHVDWRVDNLGFDGSDCVAIYDWDSLALAPEAVFVGAAAVSFTAGWHSATALPTIEEVRAFVVDYEQARGQAFTSDDRELVDLAGRIQCAYGARCQRSDERRGVKTPSANSWSLLLRAWTDEGPFG